MKDCNSPLVISDGGEIIAQPPAPGMGCACDDCKAPVVGIPSIDVSAKTVVKVRPTRAKKANK